MTTLENENFLRLTLLVFECGSFIARHILDREVASSTVQNLDALLKSHQSRLLKIISRKHGEKLFPRKDPVDPGTWDFALLSTVLINVFFQSLSKTEKNQLEKLRYIRHELSHAALPSIDESMYNDKIAKISNALEKLCKHLNPGIGEECKSLVNKYVKDPLDFRCTLEYMKAHSGVELFQTILSKFEGLEEGILSAVSNSKEEILEELRALKKEMLEKLKTHNAEENVFTGIKIKVDTVRSEDKHLIQTMFINIVENAKKKANNPDDDEEVKDAIQSLLDEINRINGANVDGAMKSCILLKVQCTTIGGISGLLQYLDSDDLRVRLLTISKAIRSCTGISCTFSVHESLENYDQIKQVLSSIYKRKNAKEQAITLPVRVTSAWALQELWSLFEEGGARKSLGCISSAFAKLTGRKAVIFAELDLEQFQRALRSIGKVKPLHKHIHTEFLEHIAMPFIPKEKAVGKYHPFKKTTVWFLNESELTSVALNDTSKAKEIGTSFDKEARSTLMANTSASVPLEKKANEESDKSSEQPAATSKDITTSDGTGVKKTDIVKNECAIGTLVKSVTLRTNGLHTLEETLTKTILERKDFRTEQEINQEIDISATTPDVISEETARLLKVFVTRLDIMIQKKTDRFASKLDSAVNELITLIHSVNNVYIHEVIEKCVLLKIRCSSCHSMRELLKTFQKPVFENAVKRIEAALQKECPNVISVCAKVSDGSIENVEAHLKESGVQVDDYSNLACNVHPEESVTLYCSDHYVFCCQICGQKAHGTCSGLRQITSMTDDSSDAGNLKMRITEKRIKVKKDKKTCDIYGCCVLPNGEILIVDNSNKRLKKLNQNFHVVSHISMSDKPWDVCDVGNNEAAVALYDCVQFVNYERKLIRTRLVKFDHDSNGIAFDGKHFFVVDDWNIYSYTPDIQNKKVLYSCGAGTVWFNHIAISKGKNLIYISDRYGGVHVIDSNGKHQCTLKPNELQNTWGICLDSTERVLVTDADTCSIHSFEYQGDEIILDAVVTQEDNMTKPMCLSFDDKRSNLIIGHYQKDAVSVLKMK